MNLVCKVDVPKIDDKKFQKLRLRVEKKMQQLWNKQTSSSKNSDLILEHLGKLFVVKNETRWNSLWDGFHRVVYFMKEKPDELRQFMDAFKIPQFQAAEQQSMTEYVRVMRPIIDALDIFQGEENVGMGYLLPTLTVLYRKLNNLKKTRTSNNVNH